jgi:hypothetical protein
MYNPETLSTLASDTNIAEIVLKVALNTIKQTSNLNLSEKKITHKMYNNFWNMSDKAHTFILHLGIKSYQISPLRHAPSLTNRYIIIYYIFSHCALVKMRIPCYIFRLNSKDV